MNTKPVSQIDRSGMFACVVLADESPLEPGVWLMPFGTVDQLPPGTYVDAEQPGVVGQFTPAWPADKWPHWNGAAFALEAKLTPAQAPTETPAQKLAAFLAANPDVAALVSQSA